MNQKSHFSSSIILSFFLFLSCIVSQGCGVAALVAGAGYASSSNRKATAAMMQAQNMAHQQYLDYQVAMEKINLEREKSNLKPRPIPTFEEWVDNQRHLSPREKAILTRKFDEEVPIDEEEQKKIRSKRRK